MSFSKFALQNDTGERYSLNPYDGAAFHSVNGLGVNSNQLTADLENGFFKPIGEKIPLNTITGEILFKGSAYEKYREMVDFITSTSRLYLVYCPYGSDEFYCEIRMNYFTKTNRKLDWASMPVSFICLTPWYKPVPVGVAFSAPAVGNYFAWNIGRIGVSRIAPNTSGAFSATVSAEGHIPAAVRVMYEGDIINPTFVLTGLNTDTEYGRCSLSGNYSGVIELDTRYGDSSIRYNGADALNDVDLNFFPFFRIPVTEPCKLELRSSEMAGKCTAEVYEFYRSV